MTPTKAEQPAARTSPVHQPAHSWTDADADAARLALELECLLTDRDTPMPLTSRWWNSAHEALALHRQRLDDELREIECPPDPETVDRAMAAEQAAKAVPADPCVVLWQAMNEAEKVGNRTDDKLIVWALRRAGYCIAAISEQEPCHDAWRAALAQHREPLTDEDWRTRDSSDTDEGCAALHRAHGIGATTGEQR